MDPILDYVCQTFEWISNVSSRKAKENQLRILADHPDASIIAQELFSIALDWYRHYGIASVPEIVEPLCTNSGTAGVFFKHVSLMESVTTSTDNLMTVLHSFSPLTAKWLRRCVMKDLKMGVSTTTVHKVWPCLIRTFECHLAEVLTDPEALTYPVLVEPKIDGVRAICRIEDGKAKFLSRGGQMLFNTEHLFLPEALRLMSGFVLDGELYAGSLPKTMSVVRTSVNEADLLLKDSLRYLVFDMLPLEEWDRQESTMHQVARSDFLKNLPEGLEKVNRVASRMVHSSASLVSFYEECLSAGYEGIMVKKVEGLYAFGRSSNWMKFKPVEVDNFSVVAKYEGEGRLAGTLGGFIIDIPGSGVCRVGGGFNDSQRTDFWLNDLPKFIRVKYKEKTADGLLREPVFLKVVDGLTSI